MVYLFDCTSLCDLSNFSSRLAFMRTNFTPVLTILTSNCLLYFYFWISFPECHINNVLPPTSRSFEFQNMTYSSFLHTGQILNSVPHPILPTFKSLPFNPLSYFQHISVSFLSSFISDTGAALTLFPSPYLLPYFIFQYPQTFSLIISPSFYHFPFFG